MNRKRVIIPPNSSLLRIVWNRQPYSTISNPQLILEKFFRKNFGFFHDFSHILAHKFLQRPISIEIACPFHRPITRASIKGTGMISGLIPFFLDNAEIGRKFEKYENS